MGEESKLIKLSDAARIAGITSIALWNWINRGQVTLKSLEVAIAESDGEAHRVSLFAVERLAITAALKTVGVDIRTAWAASGKFYVSKGPKSGARWEIDKNPVVMQRDAGELFPSGETVLLVYADGDAHVINAETLDAVPIDCRKAVFPVVALPLNRLIATVRKEFAKNRSFYRR